MKKFLAAGGLLLDLVFFSVNGLAVFLSGVLGLNALMALSGPLALLAVLGCGLLASLCILRVPSLATQLKEGWANLSKSDENTTEDQN